MRPALRQHTVFHDLKKSQARIAQSVERKTLNLVVQGSPTSRGDLARNLEVERSPLFGRILGANDAASRKEQDALVIGPFGPQAAKIMRFKKPNPGTHASANRRVAPASTQAWPPGVRPKVWKWGGGRGRRRGKKASACAETCSMLCNALSNSVPPRGRRRSYLWTTHASAKRNWCLTLWESQTEAR